MLLHLCSTCSRIDAGNESLLYLKGRKLVLVHLDQSHCPERNQHSDNKIDQPLLVYCPADPSGDTLLLPEFHHSTVLTFIPLETLRIPSTITCSLPLSPSVMTTPVPENSPVRTYFLLTVPSQTVQT